MKKIYIVGGNGFARECYYYLEIIKKLENSIEIGGFLGHGGYGKTVDYKQYQHLYKGEVSEHEFKDNEYVVIGAGYPELRKKIYTELKQRDIKFYNLILNCNEKFFSERYNIGEANIIISSSISVNINMGNCNVLNGGVVMGHDVEIGDLNFLGPRCQLLGNVKVGNCNKIGTNSLFLPNSKIGNNNIIAPLSVIYKGCKNNCYMVGNPALKIGDVE